MLKKIILPFLFCATVINAENFQADFGTVKISKEVVAIPACRFSGNNPEDKISLRWKSIMNKTCREILNEWWNESQCKGSEGKYIDFGYLENNSKSGEFGKETKGGIRNPAEYAYTIAVAIFTKSYDENIIGISEKDGIKRSVTIIKSLAKDHLVNGGIGTPWGNMWQSAQWAGKTAIAGWLLWNYMAAADKEYLRKMIEYEADRFLATVPPAANEDYVNDTKAEEDGWQADGIQAACAMMPNHPHLNAWYEKAIEYRITAMATPSDLKNETIVYGKAVRERVAGYNIDSLGALGNHSAYPHPDYMAAPIRHAIEGAVFLMLADLKVPEANEFNSSLIYNNFCSHVWHNESAIYKNDGTIYWPIKIEDDRRFEYLTFGIVDAAADFWRLNAGAGEWEDLHTSKAVELNLTGYLSASAYLLHWLNKN